MIETYEDSFISQYLLVAAHDVERRETSETWSESR